MNDKNCAYSFILSVLYVSSNLCSLYLHSNPLR